MTWCHGHRQMFTFAMNNYWTRFFVTFTMMKVEVSVVTTATLIIADITKTESNIVLLYIVLK